MEVQASSSRKDPVALALESHGRGLLRSLYLPFLLNTIPNVLTHLSAVEDKHEVVFFSPLTAPVLG